MNNFLIQNINNHNQVLANKKVSPSFTAIMTASNNAAVSPIGTNILEKFLQQTAINASTQVAPVQQTTTAPVQWKNNLKTMFNNNEATIMGIIIRNFGAKDIEGDQLLSGKDIKGNFNNAIPRLDELKNLGINTLHLLPLNPPGKLNAKGTAGSLYAPEDFLKIDPALDDKNDPRTVEEEFKNFVDECHKRGIHVMLDLPSCASLSLFNQRPDLMAFERNGLPKTPQGWEDIRMLSPWLDEEKKQLNPAVLDMHKKFVDMCQGFGLDGIRADVARTKPTEFWDIIISYSRAKDPEFAWLAESYTYEDASPQANMNYDRPEDLLKAGFDNYYGQYHIFHEWTKAHEFTDYIKENIKMDNQGQVGKGKSLIGSFGTHDDISLMNNGGANFINLVSGLQATIPMVNPYYMDGYQSGDDYKYDFLNKYIPETETDKHDSCVHDGRPDIFNFSRPLIGKHPEVGTFMKSSLDMRKNYQDIVTKGSFITLPVKNNPSDQIIAFTRHYKGRTLLVIANRDINGRQKAVINVPGLSANSNLQNLLPSYGEESHLQADNNMVSVDLGAARVHVFEVNTPNIENSGLEVFRQNI